MYIVTHMVNGTRDNDPSPLSLNQKKEPFARSKGPKKKIGIGY